MKRLLALSLMLSLLAIGTPAASTMLGVSMGDPLEPNDGWEINGVGFEVREYEGELPFDKLYIKGTREGGACDVTRRRYKTRSRRISGDI